MRITLSDERKQTIIGRLTAVYASEFDLDLSPFQAGRVLDFFIKNLGPPVYNQAIQDARKFFSDKLEDLDTDFYVPDHPQE
jgi:uncharacterized protein (DUF2164 family)